jgi:hypothetical protein
MRADPLFILWIVLTYFFVPGRHTSQYLFFVRCLTQIMRPGFKQGLTDWPFSLHNDEDAHRQLRSQAPTRQLAHMPCPCLAIQNQSVSWQRFHSPFYLVCSRIRISGLTLTAGLVPGRTFVAE